MPFKDFLPILRSAENAQPSTVAQVADRTSAIWLFDSYTRCIHANELAGRLLVGGPQYGKALHEKEDSSQPFAVNTERDFPEGLNNESELEILDRLLVGAAEIGIVSKNCFLVSPMGEVFSVLVTAVFDGEAGRYLLRMVPYDESIIDAVLAPTRIGRNGDLLVCGTRISQQHLSQFRQHHAQQATNETVAEAGASVGMISNLLTLAAFENLPNAQNTFRSRVKLEFHSEARSRLEAVVPGYASEGVA